ncbi:MAG: efflux RND transporter permease subunit [Rhodospirillales bacterium]|nr:efflux RND transporter permease subunit [Rhodospirillales bacterium]
MIKLIDAAFHYSRTVLSVLVLILGAGVVAYVTIPKENNPDINIPLIYVSMTHDGISPEDAERLLVRPMEKELRGIDGVKEMRAVAQEGRASLTMEFTAGFDADQALTDVREKVDLAKSELPDDTEEPRVREVNFGLFPVVVVTLSGHVPERLLFKLADDLEARIEAIPSVLAVDIVGDREELLEVVVDPTRLESYGISGTELLSVVTRNNRLVAAGVIDTGEGRFAIKVPGLLENAKDVFNLPIKVKDDAVVTLGDLSSVRRTFKDRASYARINGEPAIALEVKKRLGENVIETMAMVRALIEQEQVNWPEGVSVKFSQDQSVHIRNMLNELQNNVIAAVILVMVVVVAALGLRTAGLVGLAIPGSFLFGILALQMFGLTINMVVLFALILAVGLLVDGAIVVTEYADRKMTEGETRKAAYALAAKRMAWPITASTATTLAAFLPLLFWPGLVGEFMKFMPITLVMTLTGSLLMALLFVPVLGGLIGKTVTGNVDVLKALAVAEKGDVTALPGFTGWYARLLSHLVKTPFRVIGVAVAVLVAVQGYYAFAGNGVELFPNSERNFAKVYVHARGNLSIDEKDTLVREVENQVLQVEGIKIAYTRVGKTDRDHGKAEDVIGTMNLELHDSQDRPPVAAIMDAIRARTDGLAGIEVELFVDRMGPGTGKNIQITVLSQSPSALMPTVEKFRAKLASMEGVVDLEDSRPLPGIEWMLDVDRAQAGKFGADVTAVGNVVKLVTNGVKVGEYRPDDAKDEVDIRVRFPLDDRTIGELDQLRVQTAEGLIPISNFVERKARPKVGTLNRTNGARVIKLQANTEPGVLPSGKVSEIRDWMETADLDPRAFVVFKGEDEEEAKASAFLEKAFAVAIFVMAVILVTQFNSFYHAFLILTAVVMSTVGVVLGLMLTGKPFSIIMNGIGVIALAGIVVNNNIVLIDTYARLKRAGMETLEAIVRTGAQRLRPVMLTTVTTVFGLLPMVFQVNIDFLARNIELGASSSQFWAPLATSVAFGLAFATVLTLIVTPCLLAAPVSVAAWRDSRKRVASESAAQ